MHVNMRSLYILSDTLTVHVLNIDLFVIDFSGYIVVNIYIGNVLHSFNFFCQLIICFPPLLQCFRFLRESNPGLFDHESSALITRARLSRCCSSFTVAICIEKKILFQMESDTKMVLDQLEKDSNDIMNLLKKERTGDNTSYIMTRFWSHCEVYNIILAHERKRC